MVDRGATNTRGQPSLFLGYFCKSNLNNPILLAINSFETVPQRAGSAPHFGNGRDEMFSDTRRIESSGTRQETSLSKFLAPVLFYHADPRREISGPVWVSTGLPAVIAHNRLPPIN
jgi:hypothetical protein